MWTEGVVSNEMIELAQLAKILPLDEQDCIEMAAKAAFKDKIERAEYWRNLAGYTI